MSADDFTSIALAARNHLDNGLSSYDGRTALELVERLAILFRAMDNEKREPSALEVENERLRRRVDDLIALADARCERMTDMGEVLKDLACRIDEIAASLRAHVT